MNASTYDESLFDIPEVADKMSPAKKTFGQQAFEWLRGPGSIILTIAFAMFSFGGKLSDFRNEVAQIRIDQAAQVKVEEKRTELLNTLIQSQNANSDALVDVLRLMMLPYTPAQMKREAERIKIKIEQQKRISQNDNHWRDAVGTGGALP